MRKNRVWLAPLLVALLAVGMLCVWLFLRPAGTAGEKTISVAVTHLDDGERRFTVQTREEFLGPALEAAGLISGTRGKYGLFIDTVDGEYADPAQKQWWVFTVNGEQGVYGADEQPLADGDVYAFSIYAG